MALIECSECSREISSKAPACPHCGAPALMDRESAGSGVAHLTTVQATSKRLKLHSMLSMLAILVGVVWMIVEYQTGGIFTGWPFLIFAAGFLYYFIIRIRIWWHHA